MRDTILGRVSLETGTIFLDEIGLSDDVLPSIERITLIACGTSWHAALVGKFLIEELARVPVEVDYGSRVPLPQPARRRPTTLAVAITQSGETADTLAALREAKQQGRAQPRHLQRRRHAWRRARADGTIYTHAGPEIGVASTKAFTSQLVALVPAGAAPGARRAGR